MAFGNVQTPKGLEELNKFLAEHSYIEGYAPSKADVGIFDALKKCPTGNSPHVQRWYRHIASFSAQEKGTWTGTAAAPAAKAAAPAADDDDDVDLFGSEDEEETAEAAKIREERVAAYSAKKSNKPVLIAKSSILLDVKPWDDETSMVELEKVVRSVQMEGLLWGASKLMPVGYGINKLQICCVIVDDLVSVDLLQETITEFEDFVQSVDIAAFNKI